MLKSLADIARDTIARKNPFPALEGFPSNAYACHCWIDDMYKKDEDILRDAIENRKTFDTGWVGCKKEIVYFRIISDGNVMTLQTSAKIDELPELIYDAMDEEVELSEEQTEQILNMLYETEINEPYTVGPYNVFSTSADAEETIPFSDYETVIKKLCDMASACDDILDKRFSWFKNWLNTVALPAIMTDEKGR